MGDTSRLEKRARAVRARAAVRGWEYRQRHHSKGCWARLCRVLAHAERAYALDAASLDQLAAEGWREEPVGAEFHPARRLVWLTAERLAKLPSRRSVPVNLVTAQSERFLALVAFSPRAEPGEPSGA